MLLNYPMRLTILTGIILGGIFGISSYCFNICEELSLFLNNKLFILVLLSFISGLFVSYKLSKENSFKDCAKYNFYCGVISTLMLVIMSLMTIINNFQKFKEFEFGNNYVYIALIFVSVFMPLLLVIVSNICGGLTYNLFNFFHSFKNTGFKENKKFSDQLKNAVYGILTLLIAVLCFIYVLNNPWFHLVNHVKNPFLFTIITITALILLILPIICISNLLELLLFKDKIKQDIKNYRKTKVRELLVALFLFVPTFTVFLAVKAYYSLSPFLSVVIAVILLFVVSTVENIILLISLKLKILKEGEKYDFWIQKAIETGIKIYPIIILPDKINLINVINAYAIGIKKFGLIFASKSTLDNLSKEQFAAVIAHETYHIENNHLLIRLLLKMSMVISIIFVFTNIMKVGSSREYNFPLYFSAIFMVILFPVFSKVSIMQEYKADYYSKTFLNNGEYLYSALKYLSDSNTGFTENHLKTHPLLEERKRRLLEE